MSIQGGHPTDRGAKERRRRRSDVWRWVYGPLLGGVAVLAAVGVCAGGVGGGGVGVWADVSIIYLTVLSMIVLLLVGVVVGVVLYGAVRLSGWLPPVMRQSGAWVDRAGRGVKRGADITVQPVLWFGALRSAARFVLKRIGSFKR